MLTEERRRELVKEMGKYIESAKVAIRNIRRDAMDTAKKSEKAKKSQKMILKILKMRFKK